MKRFVIFLIITCATLNVASAQTGTGSLVSFRSFFGPFINAQNGGGAYTVATSGDIQQDESFVLTDYTNQSLTHGDEVSLKCLRSDKYLSARLDIAGAPLMAIGSGPWAWERFRIYKSSGSGSINSGDETYLVAANGRIISTRFDQNSNPLAAVAGGVGSWEKFRIQIAPAGFKLTNWSKGVRTYTRSLFGISDYVTVVDLTRAEIKSIGAPVRAGRLIGQRPDWFWYFASQGQTPYCMINGTFFNSELIHTLVLGLKIDGNVVMRGTQVGPNSRALCFYGTSADIRGSITDCLNDSSVPDVIGSYVDTLPTLDTAFTGRTLLGLNDAFGEGRYQTAYIYSCSAAQKNPSLAVLRHFGSTNICQLDGGASSTLILQGQLKISARRPTLPHMMYVIPR